MQTEQTWRTSSHSGNANDCVELTVGAARTKIRDSKNPDGGVLTVPSVADIWDDVDQLRAAEPTPHAGSAATDVRAIRGD